MAKLLKEYVSIADLEVLIEDCGGEGCKKEKKIRVSGPFMEAEVINQNGRFYGRKVLEESLATYQMEYINAKKSVGCLDHDSDANLAMDRISHYVESLKFSDNPKDHKVYGVARILSDLPCGKIFATLVKEGVLCGFSSRAIGELDSDRKVKQGLILLSCDAVINPSAKSAVIESVVEESKEYILEGNQIIETAIHNLREKVDKKYNSKENLKYLMDFLQDIQMTKDK